MENNLSFINENDKELLKAMGIEVIDEKRNYWFIRTQGGAYFDDFYFDGYVGIEWDEISNIKEIKTSTYESLKGEVAKFYPSIGNHGYVAGQIKRFVEDIKKGDIVLIPNANSERIAFGEVVDDEVYIYEDNLFEAYLNDTDGEFEKKPVIKKRRRVNWIKNIKRKEIDPYLYKIIYSHSAIVDAKPYEVFIDRTLSQFYVKGEKAYLSYKVNQKKDISGIDISGFVYNSINLLDEVEGVLNEDVNKRDITTKINVQSEGIIQFIGPLLLIFSIGVGVSCIAGGEVSFLGLKFKTEGLSKTILHWVESLHKIKIENKLVEKNIEEAVTRLQITLPKLSDDAKLCNENVVDEVEEEDEEEN